jgi:hypothetical protein
MLSQPLQVHCVTFRVKMMIEIIIFLSLGLLVLVFGFRLFYSLKFKAGKHQGMVKAVVGSTYFARTNEFKIYNRFAKSDGIVFVGDSLTQRYPLNEFYPGMHVYNRGIDGDTTAGLSKRLDLSIFDLQPKIVVLQIGTNDLQVIGVEKEQTVANIHEIIDSIKTNQPNINIILVSLYPVNETGEKLVENIIVGPRKNKDLLWDGWTVISSYPSEKGRTSKFGARVNGKWHLQRRFELTRKGWDIPKNFVR